MKGIYSVISLSGTTVFYMIDNFVIFILCLRDTTVKWRIVEVIILKPRRRSILREHFMIFGLYLVYNIPSRFQVPSCSWTSLHDLPFPVSSKRRKRGSLYPSIKGIEEENVNNVISTLRKPFFRTDVYDLYTVLELSIKVNIWIECGKCCHIVYGPSLRL